MILKFFLWLDFVSLSIIFFNFFKYMYKGNDDFGLNILIMLKFYV